MSAAQRIAALDSLSAVDLCQRAEDSLRALVEIMNEETTLLRAGRMREAGALTPDKTRLAQDYVGFARTVQRQILRLQQEAPAALERLQGGHERLATQMAENLRVIATARNITDDLLTETAAATAARQRPSTYGDSGKVAPAPRPFAGIAFNKSS